jgi:hypothetical protein
MKCDSQASLLARTFASLCFGRKPKARVATILVIQLKGLELCIQLNMLVLVISTNYSKETLLAFVVFAWIQTTRSV